MIEEACVIGTEQTLLDAAESVLAERGLDGVTVADITQAAGVAKGTFYLYFATKEDVVREVQRRHFHAMLARVAEAAAQLEQARFWSLVDSLVDTIAAYDIEHRDWYRKVAQGWAPPPSEFANEREQMNALVAGAIRQGMAEGECHAEDPEMTAILLCSAIEGSLHQVCMTEAEPDADRLCRELKGFVRKALAGPTL